MLKRLLYIIILATITLTAIGATATSPAFAEKPTYTVIPKPGPLPGPTPDEQLKGGGAKTILVDKILPIFGIGMIGFVGGMSLIFLVIAGVRFTISYGNDENIQKAKDQATYALIGLVIAILSYTIVRIITNVKIEGNQTTFRDNIEIINIV